MRPANTMWQVTTFSNRSWNHRPQTADVQFTVTVHHYSILFSKRRQQRRNQVGAKVPGSLADLLKKLNPMIKAFKRVVDCTKK